MPLPSLSLAIVGADHPNQRGPTRRFGIALCRPGDIIELLPEPTNKVDPGAVAAYAGGVQIGYVRAERAPLIRKRIADGIEVAAIFQEATDYGCVVRVAFDEMPVLPPPRPDAVPADEFPADPIWDED